MFSTEYGCHWRSEEHTSELQSHLNIVCRLLLEKKRRLFTHRLGCEHLKGLDGKRVYVVQCMCVHERALLSFYCGGLSTVRFGIIFFFLIEWAPPEFSSLPPHAPLRV